MERKPIQIILLALAQLLNPVINIALNSFYFHVSPMVVVRSVFYASSWTTPVEFFLIGPVSAIAIYAVKKWSFPVFLLCSVVTAGGNISVWYHNPQAVSVGMVLGLCFTNIALVAYLLLPQVRVAYFEPRIRWWESKPRYQQRITSNVVVSGKQTVGSILNISEGGIFLETDQLLKSGETVSMQFEVAQHLFSMTGKIVYERKFDPHGFGVQFQHTKDTRAPIRKAIRDLENKGVERLPSKRHIFAEIRDLVFSLVKGRGWVPQMSARVARAKSKEADKKAA